MIFSTSIAAISSAITSETSETSDYFSSPSDNTTDTTTSSSNIKTGDTIETTLWGDTPYNMTSTEPGISIGRNSDLILRILDQLSQSRFNLPNFIKAWADNFIFTIDQQYESMIDHVLSNLWLSTSYPIEGNQIWKSKVTGLAQDKSMAFLASGSPILYGDSGESQKMLQRKSQPFSSSKSFLASLWLKGALFPAVSPNSSSDTTYPLADPKINLKCFTMALLDIYLQTDEEPIYTSDGPMISDFQRDECVNYGQGNYSDTYNRFSPLEIDILLGGMANGIYFDVNNNSNNLTDTAQMKKVLKLYMAVSYAKPVLDVCSDILDTLSRASSDFSSVEDACESNDLGDLCKRCADKNEFVNMYNGIVNSFTGTNAYLSSLQDTDGNVDVSFDDMDPLKITASLPSIISTNDIEKGDADENYLDQDFSVMSEKNEDLIGMLETLQDDMLPIMLEQMVTVMENKQNKVPFMSLDTLFAQDQLFDVPASQLDCSGVNWDTVETDAYTPTSSLINDVTIFLSNLSGDAAWTYQIESPSAPLNFLNNNDLLSSPQPWSSSWTSMTQQCSETSPSSCFAWADNGTNKPVGQLTDSEISKFRVKTRSSVVNQNQSVELMSLILNKSIMSTSLYKELVDRSVNLHAKVSDDSQLQMYCSPKMARRSATQWRLEPSYKDQLGNTHSWAEELWLSDPATILRHVAVMLAEINLKSYELNESVTNIDIARSSSKLKDVQKQMIEYSDMVSDLSQGVYDFDAGRRTAGDVGGGI